MRRTSGRAGGRIAKRDLSATGSIYQCAIASDGNTKSGRFAARRGINTVDSPRTAQTAVRSGRQRERGTSVEREKERGETVVGESERERGEGVGASERQKKREIERTSRLARRSRCTEPSTSGQGHRAEG